MSQPPNSTSALPDWRRPRGVAKGTWHYVNQPSIAESYDEFVESTKMCEVDMRMLRKIFPIAKTSASILDLGCGSGRATIELAARGYRVVAIDLSDSMLGRLKQKLSKQPFADDVDLVKANLVDLGCLGDRVADHAICLFSTVGMIQGQENRRKFLRHVSRIVRPGGRLVLHAHHRWAALREDRGWRSLCSSWYRSLREPDHEFGDAVYGYRGLESMFLHRFSRAELIGLLRTSGWSISSVTRLSIEGEPTTRLTGVTGGFIVEARSRV